MTNKAIFKDYYFSNKGILYKTFETNINKCHYIYDIYWGEPEIIFEGGNGKNNYSLAVSIIPQRKNYPNSRIYLHKKLGLNNKNIFEVVVAHEIGHLFLHDVIGINHQMTNSYMKESETEIWADYFAYSFFKKFREINAIEEFYSIMKETSDFQMQLYNLDVTEYKESTYYNKIKNVKLLDDKINMEMTNPYSVLNQIINAIEITLDEIGDLFK